MKLTKEYKIGKVYELEDGIKLFYRNKGTVSGDNDINVAETIYFVDGNARITLRDKVWDIQSPERIEFPANTYHKIEAITDISFILFEN